MRAIDGNLPISADWHIISADYNSPAIRACDNCGLPIATEVTIEGRVIVNGILTDKTMQYTVGEDCAEGLVSRNGRNMNWYIEKSKLKNANQTKSYLAKLRKAKRENRLKIDERGNGVIYDRTLPDDKAIWSIKVWSGSKAMQFFNKGGEL